MIVVVVVGLNLTVAVAGPVRQVLVLLLLRLVELVDGRAALGRVGEVDGGLVVVVLVVASDGIYRLVGCFGGKTGGQSIWARCAVRARDGAELAADGTRNGRVNLIGVSIKG